MKTVGDVVRTTLGAEVDRLLNTEPEVRANAPDSIHQMRVATRRIRSLLRSYRRALTKPAHTARTELAWLAGVLSVARDAEVRAQRFAALLNAHVAESTSETIDSATTRLVTTEWATYRLAHHDVVTALNSARYRRLREELNSWRTNPPVRTSRSAGAAHKFCADVMHRDHRRLQRLIDAERKTPGANHNDLLHEIRKTAKRLRYSCEAAVPILGKPAKALATWAKHLQTVLGDHRDAIESHDSITARAADAQAAGEDITLYQVLASAESKAADQALTRYRKTIAAH